MGALGAKAEMVTMAMEAAAAATGEVLQPCRGDTTTKCCGGFSRPLARPGHSRWIHFKTSSPSLACSRRHHHYMSPVTMMVVVVAVAARVDGES